MEVVCCTWPLTDEAWKAISHAPLPLSGALETRRPHHLGWVLLLCYALRHKVQDLCRPKTQVGQAVKHPHLSTSVIVRFGAAAGVVLISPFAGSLALLLMAAYLSPDAHVERLEHFLRLSRWRQHAAPRKVVEEGIKDECRRPTELFGQSRAQLAVQGIQVAECDAAAVRMSVSEKVEGEVESEDAREVKREGERESEREH
jgi:hypothetical protein